MLFNEEGYECVKKYFREKYGYLDEVVGIYVINFFEMLMIMERNVVKVY